MIRLILISLLVLVGGCGGGDAEEKRGDLSVIAISEESVVFQPLLGDWPLKPELIAGAVSRGLVKLDGNGQVVPDLATSWRVSDDGRSIIFRLREAEWTDGRDVTGQDFVRMFRAVMARDSKHPFKQILSVIENGADVAAGKKPPSALGVLAPIPEVVEIRLSAPRPSLLQIMAHPAMGIADRNMSSVALGPFRFGRNEDGVTELVPNPDFTDPGSVQLDRIGVVAHSEAAIALQNYKREQKGVLLGGTTGDFQLARASGLDRFLRLDPVRGIYGYRPVSMEGPLADPRIRQALAMVIDREAVAASTGAGTASPIYGVVSWGLSDLPQPYVAEWVNRPLADRVADAQALMRSARGDIAANPLVLRVAIPHGPGHAALLNQIAQSWLQVGVRTEPVKAGDKSADLEIVETVAPADSATWFLNMFRCRKNGYCNSQVDALLDQARSAQDAAARRKALMEAEQLLVVDQPMIPLFTPIRWSMVDPNVLGWADNAVGQHPLAALSVISGNQGLLGGNRE